METTEDEKGGVCDPACLNCRGGRSLQTTMVKRGTNMCPLCKGELPEIPVVFQIVQEKSDELIALLELFKLQHEHGDPMRCFTLLKIRNHIDALRELDKLPASSR